MILLYRILAALILSLSLGLASPTHAQETSAVLDGGSMIVGYDGQLSFSRADLR